MSNFSELEPVMAVFTPEYWSETCTAEPSDTRLKPGLLLNKAEIKDALGSTALATLMGANHPTRLVSGTRLAYDMGSHSPDYLLPGSVWLVDREKLTPKTRESTPHIPSRVSRQELNRRITTTDSAELVREDSGIFVGQDDDYLLLSGGTSFTQVIKEDMVYSRNVKFMIMAEHRRGLALHQLLWLTAYKSGKISPVMLKSGALRLPDAIGQTQSHQIRDSRTRVARLRAVQVCKTGHPAREKKSVFATLLNIAPQSN